MRNLGLLAVAGIAVAVVGVFVAPERTWPNILLANYYLLGIGLAGALLISLQYISNASWGVAIRRVPEAMIHVLPVSAIVMILLLFGLHNLYEWTHQDVVQQDPILQSKTWWLNVPSFITRMIIILGLWLALAFALVKISKKQDESGDIGLVARGKKYSAIFIVIFGLTFTMASMDWIMSLEPHWYSTIFAIYNFAGLFLAGLAVVTIVVIHLRREGPLKGIVTEEHLHDLGKLMFAFSTFWMYIWFSQYLLIWYANIPEEAAYYVHRQHGSWGIFTLLNVVFNWCIPFVILLPKWTKRHEGILLKVCTLILIGHWIDLFWMIMPPFMKENPVISIWEVGPMIGAIALGIYIIYAAFSRSNPVPLRDPYLEESLHYHS